jgi:hypothetical protein
MDRCTTLIARTLAAMLPVVILLLACGGDARSPSRSSPTSSAGEEQVQATVTLGIYSGRPDPSWILTDAQAADVDAAIQGLAVTTGNPPDGGLGYHGFTLVLRRPGQVDETLVAYQATVAPPGVGPRPYRVDPGRTVERLLLESGRSTLTPEEVAAVDAALR